MKVVSELEHGRGWLFGVEIEQSGGDGGPERREMTLSWADHERWSGGAKPPSEVAEQALRFAAARGLLARLGARFDASTVRRLAPDIEDFLVDGGQDAGLS